jgi:hypothetical protein
MLLWLEEAAIEIAMIVATALGAFMFVAAVASLVYERLRERRRSGRRSATRRLVVTSRDADPAGHGRAIERDARAPW